MELDKLIIIQNNCINPSLRPKKTIIIFQETTKKANIKRIRNKLTKLKD